MAHLELDISRWANQQFGDCKLGDKRRTKRIVKLAEQVAAHPDGSTPEQTHEWGDCKAAYRLFDSDDVSFGTICEPHWQLTRAQIEGTWLLIGDTTEIDFGIHRETTGLGPTGNGGGLGFLLHSSLATLSRSKHSKFAITDIREKPVDFFYCSTRASALASTIILQTQVPSQKFPILFIYIIP